MSSHNFINICKLARDQHNSFHAVTAYSYTKYMDVYVHSYTMDMLHVYPVLLLQQSSVVLV